VNKLRMAYNLNWWQEATTDFSEMGIECFKNYIRICLSDISSTALCIFENKQRILCWSRAVLVWTDNSFFEVQCIAHSFVCASGSIVSWVLSEAALWL